MNNKELIQSLNMSALKAIFVVVVVIMGIIVPAQARTIVLNNQTTTNDLRCAKNIIIQTDVNLNGKSLVLAKRTTIHFDGGSISNGSIVLNRTLLEGDVKVYADISGSVRNDIVYVNWFLRDNDLDGIYSCGLLSLTGMKELHLKPGHYIQSVRSLSQGITIQNVVLDGEGSAINAKTGGGILKSLLPFVESSNVTIKNLKLVGTLKEDDGEGARHNLVLSMCKGVTVENITSKDAYTDGLYLRNSCNIQINNFKAFTSGRQGCSITAGDDISFHNCLFDGSYRFAPKSGLDIEPNYDSDEINRIYIDQCRFSNNEAAGLTIKLRTREEESKCYISVTNCIFDGNGYNIGVASSPNSGTGIIDINNCLLKNSKGVSFQSKCYSAIGTPKVRLRNCTLENANLGNGQDVREQATFISVHNVSSRPLQGDYGNVEFENLVIKQAPSLANNLRRAINVYPDSRWKVSNVKISGITFEIGRKEDKEFRLMSVPNERAVNITVSE